MIVGFGAEDRSDKTIYDYRDVRGEPTTIPAKRINPYLVDAADALLPNRSSPICAVPKIGIGNKPIDGGHYLFSSEERDAFVKKEPDSARWFRRWLGSDEFINGWERWCLWLGDCPPGELRKMPLALERVEAVRAFRLASKSQPTRKLALTPTRFHVENIPSSTYLIVPKVSSERREIIPIGFESETTLSSDLVFVVASASLFHFAVLTSAMHMAWVRSVCGRLESRYRYSAGIVYNNFPWPIDASNAQRAAIEKAAQTVLDARAAHPGSTLADLYDPLTMPVNLLKAHQTLDRVVDAAYGKRAFSGDAERVAFLFEHYQKLTSSLLPVVPAKRRKPAAGKAAVGRDSV